MFNGMVHAGLVARNVYWGEYGNEDTHALQIPSRPRYPSGRANLDLDNQWVGTAAAIVMADRFVVETCGRLLNGRW
ncbi:hypothetical protein SAMN05428965_1077 [Geodermatophilus sp. DSM 45219]|nr:hypothetical protein SAMN05428965_1077 [Geodermatophilus sp. DSM 45219]